MQNLNIKNGIIIPYNELDISSTRAGGPGGQHVNKTNTKIVIKWNIKNSNSLTEIQKDLLLKNLSPQLTSEGDLIVTNNETRSQVQNKKLAIEKLVSTIKKALYVPKKRKKTKIPTQVKESILQKKKKRSEIKKSRKKSFDD